MIVGNDIALVTLLAFGLRFLTVPVLGVAIWVCARHRGLSRHMWVLTLGVVGLLASTVWEQFSGLFLRFVGLLAQGQGDMAAWFGFHLVFDAVTRFGSWCLIAAGLHLVFGDVRRLLQNAREGGPAGRDRGSA